MIVTRVDLSDGETLQWSGTTTQRRLSRLQAVVGGAGKVSAGRAERVGGRDDAADFHVAVDLRPLLDWHGDIRCTLTVGRRLARVVWHPEAFTYPNAAEVRPVAPDRERGAQRAMRRESRGAGIRVVTAPIESRRTVEATHLAETCRLHIVAPPGDRISSVAWRAEDVTVAARPVGDDWWEWADLSLLARPGTRWSLVTTDENSESPAFLPASDLRHPAAARVFPVTLTAGGHVLALTGDAGNGIALRCRAGEKDGTA